MTTDNAQLAKDLLLKDPILSKAEPIALSRLLSHLVSKRFIAGSHIYAPGQSADFIYLIVSGTVRLDFGGRVTDLQSAHFGGEAAAETPRHIGDAWAMTEVEVLCIPRSSLTGLFSASPAIRNLLTGNLVRLASGDVPPPPAKPAKAPLSEWNAVVGWAVTLISPLLLFVYGADLGLDRNAGIFLGIFVATMFMWIFRLIDEYVPGIFALMALLITGLAPPAVVLSGFVSDGFFMAMSVLGLGALIVVSGLGYRFMLFMMRWLPNNQFSHSLGLLFTGIALTPTVPVINGRVSLITPLALDMASIMRYPFNKKAATRLISSGFTGVTLLSGVFLSSKAVNFVVFGLLPTQNQSEFQWLAWLMAAGVAGLVMLVMYIVAEWLLFRNSEPTIALPKEQLDVQSKVLGPLSVREWAAITGIAIFVIGMVSTPMHGVKPPWVGMAVLYGLLIFGFIKRADFRDRIDWPFLVYLGSIVGFVAVFNYIGLGAALNTKLSFFGEYMRNNFPLFVLMLAGTMFVLRLAVPIGASIVLAATLLMPIAQVNGVNPWVVGFMVLLFGEFWVFKYQCPFYPVLVEDFQRYVKAEGMDSVHFDEKTFLRLNLLVNLAKILAIYASIPYWKSLGLI